MMRIEFQSDARRISKRCASNRPRNGGFRLHPPAYTVGRGTLFTSYTHGFAIRLFKVRPKGKVVVESCLGCFQFPKRTYAQFTAASSVEWKQLAFGARRSASKHSYLRDVHPQRLEKSTARLPLSHKSHTTLYEKAHEPFSKAIRTFLKSLAPRAKSLGAFPKSHTSEFLKSRKTS